MDNVANPESARGKSADESARTAPSGEIKPVGPLLAAYTVGRFGVFVLLIVIFYVVNYRGFPGLIAAALISIPVSYLLFRGWRTELAERIDAKNDRKLRFKEEFRTTDD